MGYFAIPMITSSMTAEERRMEYIQTAKRNLELLVDAETSQVNGERFDYLLIMAKSSIENALDCVKEIKAR